MSYSQIIIEAAKQSNISAFYIKSKIIQEVGVQGSDSVKGNYVGYEGYYNFYNYGAQILEIQLKWIKVCKRKSMG